MTEHHLTVPRTARYYQLGEVSADTRHVWFVCHGYGQLAAYFVRHFAFLAEADPATVVVAPEGLSRFYLSGNGGRVGASWMTRDDRLHEIADHVNFLNQLADHVLAGCSPAVRITVLGFSQGTATACRWLVQARFRAAHLVLWAGGFPDDLPPATAQPLLHGLPMSVVVGTRDEFIGAPQVQAQLEQLRALGATPRLYSFEGTHTLDAAMLRTLHQTQG